MKVTHITRTENGQRQCCRGGLEAGVQHDARTYTTLHYSNGGRFHFCDEHPHDVLDGNGEPYGWSDDEAACKADHQHDEARDWRLVHAQR